MFSLHIALDSPGELPASQGIIRKAEQIAYRGKSCECRAIRYCRIIGFQAGISLFSSVKPFKSTTQWFKHVGFGLVSWLKEQWYSFDMGVSPKGSGAQRRLVKSFLGEMLSLASRTSGGEGDLIHPRLLVQSSLVSLHTSQTAPKQGSSHSGAPRKDVSNHYSDSSWIQTGKNQQTKHHLFQNQCGIILPKLTD